MCLHLYSHEVKHSLTATWSPKISFISSCEGGRYWSSVQDCFLKPAPTRFLTVAACSQNVCVHSGMHLQIFQTFYSVCRVTLILGLLLSHRDNIVCDINSEKHTCRYCKIAANKKLQYTNHSYSTGINTALLQQNDIIYLTYYFRMFIFAKVVLFCFWSLCLLTYFFGSQFCCTLLPSYCSFLLLT